MSRRHPVNARAFGMLCLLALLAGCSTTVVRTPVAPVVTAPPPVAVVDHWNFEARPPAERDGYRPPARVAVLLPLSGHLSRAAVPVRDGLLAAYYAESRRHPELDFYDTAGTPAGALAAYDEAIAAGADFVIGPLGRDEVDALFRRASRAVPMLALNRGYAAPPPGVASFALAPEDEGAAAARYLLSRNARNVLVVHGPDDNMRRAASAFGDTLRGNGGEVAATVAMYTPETSIATALASATAGGAPVDAVFLALAPQRIRGLLPQLQAAGLGDRMKVATSQLGSADPASASRLDYTAEHMLDGIAFPTTAWSVGHVAGLPSAASAGEMLPSARGPAARLFAFGHDAWLLTAYLERIARDPQAAIPGATGVLRLGADGNVLRAPAWSTWSGDSILPLANAGG